MTSSKNCPKCDEEVCTNHWVPFAGTCFQCHQVAQEAKDKDISKLYSIHRGIANRNFTRKFKLQLIKKNIDFVPWTIAIKINNKFSQKKGTA